MALDEPSIWITSGTVGRTTTPRPAEALDLPPGFWPLVPGATGLIGVTQLIRSGGQVPISVFRDTFGAIVASSVGVLTGSAICRTSHAGARMITRAVKG